MTHPNGILDTAILAAERAGEVYQLYNDIKQVRSHRAHDVQLEADCQSETCITSTIREAFPDHSILGEESGLIYKGTSDYMWFVDPLDGTVNFERGLPDYCVSIACYKISPESESHRFPTQPVAAVVYAPAHHQLYTAMTGQGARLNSDRLKPNYELLKNALVAVSIGSIEDKFSQHLTTMGTLAKAARKIRMHGSTALDLARIASGQLHGIWQPIVRSWDIAAGKLFIEETLGSFHAYPRGPHRWELIACNAGLSNSFISVIEESHECPTNVSL